LPIFTLMLEDFIIRRADGSERRVSGYRSAAPASGSTQYVAKKYSQSNLPARVDLRSYLTEIENQSQTNSCVANAVAGAYEYLVKRHLGDDSYDVSRMFIYYNARAARDSQNEDAGCYIGDAIESLKEFGACSEITWPFEESKVNKKPSEEAYEEAAKFLVEDVANVGVDLYAWKHALAEGHPIIFGVKLFKSFDAQRKKGLVPMPSAVEASRESHGGHAMVCVGYSDKDKLFIVRNSWGTEWGDQGYCYIPYEYLTNEKFNHGDNWIIRQLDNFDTDETTWQDDDESLLEDYDSELANMDEDTYQQMLDALGDYSLEYRIALLFVYGASSDTELSEDEQSEIASYLDETFEKLGSELKAKRVLRNVLQDAENEELVEETIELLNEYLSKPMLARIVNDLQIIIGVDELSDDEENFVATLIDAWQIDEMETVDPDEYEGFDDDEDEDEEESEASYLYINDFYIRTRKSAAFLKKIDELCDKYAIDEDYDYEDEKDDSDEEVLKLTAFYINTESADDFTSELESLCDKMSVEADYGYEIGTEEPEDGEESDDNALVLTDFFIRCKKPEAFFKKLDALCEEFAEDQDYDYEAGEDEDDEEMILIEDFRIVTENPDKFLAKLEALCDKSAVDSDFSFTVEGEEEEEE
jgi:C1A family cysteine protease